MAPGIRQRDKPASLAVQVMHAERQVLDRRRLVGFRASQLGRAMRRRITSPAMLLWAGGLGFAAGQFGRRQSRMPKNTERPRSAYNKVFANAVNLVVFAHTLSKAFPKTYHRAPDQNPPDPRKPGVSTSATR